MTRALKWAAAVVVALVLLAGAVWLASRLMGPAAGEREALAMIDAPPEASGRDGFAALCTLAYDVPEADQARVLAEDVRRFEAMPPAADGSTPPWTSALLDWPTLGQSRQDDPDWCSLRQSGCLERVRTAPQAYAGLLERNAVLLDRVAALADWDHFHSPFPVRFDTPLPAYQPLTRLTTRAAWQFASGEVDGGLAGACAGVVQGRRLIATGDSLIGSMIGAALVEGNATLLAEMLAEGRFSTGVLRTQVNAAMAAEAAGRQLPAWGARLLFDPERTAARGAPKFAWYCGQQARALVADDRPLLDPTPPPSRWSLACASNPVGCILADIAAPAYADYGLRLQDADARLRTMATLLWLRGQDGPIDEAALARLPASMQSPTRPLQLDAAAGTLGTALFERPREDGKVQNGTWSVPLPGSRVQPADAAP